MCKVLVTCYLPLLLVIAANGKPFTSPNGTPFTSLNEEYLKYAIDDLIKLEKMTKDIEYDGFYTPEDFSNEERRMEALGVYMAEMNTLKDESQNNVMVNNNIDRIMKYLGASVTNTTLKYEGSQQKNTQEFLEGLRKLLQSMYSSMVTVKSH
ncbi:uncharacterized protein ACDP82_007449 [Pangshura tecta]